MISGASAQKCASARLAQIESLNSPIAGKLGVYRVRLSTAPKAEDSAI